MRILLKRSPQNWLLLWSPRGKKFYPIRYDNIAFAGDRAGLREKMNALLRGAAAQVEFQDAYYSRATKTLALWR